jgi:hypothetical protein
VVAKLDDGGGLEKLGHKHPEEKTVPAGLDLVRPECAGGVGALVELVVFLLAE